MSIAWSVDDIQEIAVAAGKARDFSVVLALAGVTLVIADVVDAWFTVKENEDDTDEDALISKRLGAGITLVSVTAGKITAQLSLTNDDTEDLNPGQSYYFDLQVQTATVGPDQAAYGYVICRRPITVANA